MPYAPGGLLGGMQLFSLGGFAALLIAVFCLLLDLLNTLGSLCSHGRNRHELFNYSWVLGNFCGGGFAQFGFFLLELPLQIINLLFEFLLYGLHFLSHLFAAAAAPDQVADDTAK